MGLEYLDLGMPIPVSSAVFEPYVYYMMVFERGYAYFALLLFVAQLDR